MDNKSFIKETLELKLNILKKIENYVEVALKEKDSAMVAAIAEILKNV